MTATSAMHKKKVSVNVDIANDDGTTQTFSCNQVTVLDPESADMVLRVGDINDQKTYGDNAIPTLPDSLFLPSDAPMKVEIPSGAPADCKSLDIYWDSDTPESDNLGITPQGCAPGKRYSVTASKKAICGVME